MFPKCDVDLYPFFADASAVCTAICFTVYVWSRWMIQFLKSTQESKAKENNENKPRERRVEEYENPVNARVNMHLQ